MDGEERVEHIVGVMCPKEHGYSQGTQGGVNLWGLNTALKLEQASTTAMMQ
jgi:hypothetical protein